MVTPPEGGSTVTDRGLIDFDPAVTRLTTLLRGVPDDALTAPTPCPDWSVATLLDHVVGLTWAFTATAQKSTDAPGTSSAPVASAEHLDPSWRDTLPGGLEALSQAWKDPAAWEGLSQAGGVTMPGAVLGTVALNELTVHSWDLARATSQPFDPDPRTLQAIIALMAQSPDEGSPGMFGPPLRLGADAPTVDRAVGLSGRDPQWKP
jgi:uncharacterized protein (TIGR03086 family)